MDVAAGAWGIFVVFFIIIGIGAFVSMIFYLLFLQRSLEFMAPENRKMEPGMVWLMLIPFFSIGYQFVLVGKLADSIKAEQISRGIRSSEARPAYGLGLTMCIMTCAAVLPYIGTLVAIAALVVWIVYWVKISNLVKELKTGYGGYGVKDAEIIDDL